MCVCLTNGSFTSEIGRGWEPILIEIYSNRETLTGLEHGTYGNVWFGISKGRYGKPYPRGREKERVRDKWMDR